MKFKPLAWDRRPDPDSPSIQALRAAAAALTDTAPDYAQGYALGLDRALFGADRVPDDVHNGLRLAARLHVSDRVQGAAVERGYRDGLALRMPDPDARREVLSSGGRPPLHGADSTTVSLRLSREQHALYLQLGGALWLRRMLDEQGNGAKRGGTVRQGRAQTLDDLR